MKNKKSKNKFYKAIIIVCILIATGLYLAYVGNYIKAANQDVKNSFVTDYNNKKNYFVTNKDEALDKTQEKIIKEREITKLIWKSIRKGFTEAILEEYSNDIKADDTYYNGIINDLRFGGISLADTIF